MLDTDTKRRIDTARDILVGKVPDPKSQVEQITIALIYKFMDDMDLESEELGGRRQFFAGEFERYGWAKLMRSGLGGFETLNLYAEAITRMPQNPGIPPLFRDIFKNAYLPYRDPETLRAFLKVIDEFEYDHSERLGDAFEYLLAVLGSQGDAGQFRTPRHIIDFMVQIVDPHKDETVLDPACGTAGFLISSYKHILKANTDADGHSTLTPDERGKLAANFKGYDISPDMVRLSLVNLYLHGFMDPHIYEYDTLTSLERWNETAHVILANPPFMSPKGGIRPHNRFGVQSKRSEVLFVDYMAEHLTPDGRAGIIVPEGIIFQSAGAYTHLRRMLVENTLVAVVSLPAGVFNPYSGVKTSILILDAGLAKRADSIAFFKVENDGFGLGAQRRAVEGSDLPAVAAEIAEYLRRLRTRETLEGFEPAHGLVVPKAKIAANGDYNLSAERYREKDQKIGKYPRSKIEKLVNTITPPKKIQKTDYALSGRFPIIDQSQDLIAGWTDDEGAIIFPQKPLVIFGDHTCTVKLATKPFAQGADGIKILESHDEIDPHYLYHALRIRPLETVGYQRHFSLLKEKEIPLPPLEVQREIVAEIEGYQKVIDGARMVLAHYRPHITVDPVWPLVALGEVCTIERGASPRPIHEYITDKPDGVNWVKIGDAEVGGKYITHTKERITPEGATKSRRVKPGDFVLSNSMSFGRPYIMDTEGCIHDGWLLLRDHSDLLDKDYLYYILSSPLVYNQFERAATGGVVNNLNSEIVRSVEIPLPPIEMQRTIVAEIEAEQALVAANRELVARMEGKIQAAMARVWGEG